MEACGVVVVSKDAPEDVEMTVDVADGDIEDDAEEELEECIGVTGRFGRVGREGRGHSVEVVDEGDDTRLVSTAREDAVDVAKEKDSGIKSSVVCLAVVAAIVVEGKELEIDSASFTEAVADGRVGREGRTQTTGGRFEPKLGGHRVLCSSGVSSSSLCSMSKITSGLGYGFRVLVGWCAADQIPDPPKRPLDATAAAGRGKI